MAQNLFSPLLNLEVIGCHYVEIQLWKRHLIQNLLQKNVLEEEIVRETKSLWTGPVTDVRTALLKKMVSGVVRLRDLDTDVIDVKILHRALKELPCSFRVFQQYRGVKKVSIFGSAPPQGIVPTIPWRPNLGNFSVIVAIW